MYINIESVTATGDHTTVILIQCIVHNIRTCAVHEHAELFPYPEAVDPSDTLETGFTRLVVSQSATSAFLDCSKHKIQVRTYVVNH